MKLHTAPWDIAYLRGQRRWCLLPPVAAVGVVGGVAGWGGWLLLLLLLLPGGGLRMLLMAPKRSWWGRRACRLPVWHIGVAVAGGRGLVEVPALLCLRMDRDVRCGQT